MISAMEKGKNVTRSDAQDETCKALAQELFACADKQ